MFNFDISPSFFALAIMACAILLCTWLSRRIVLLRSKALAAKTLNPVDELRAHTLR